MKRLLLIIATLLVAGCNDRQSTTASTSPPAATTPATTTSSTAAVTASATGTVQVVDAVAKTISIAHGPIAAVNWPAMTMTFKAPDSALKTIKPGDHVAFQFTLVGMDGTITAIQRQ